MPPKKKASATAAAAAPEEDILMADASPAPADTPEPEFDIELDEQRIRIVSSKAGDMMEPILTIYIPASRSVGHCCIIRVQEGRSHAGECFAVYHHEEVSLPRSLDVSTNPICSNPFMLYFHC